LWQTTYGPFTGNLTPSCPLRPKTSVRIVKTGVRRTILFILFEREEIKKQQELSVKYSINYSSTIELTKFCGKSLTRHELRLTIYKKNRRSYQH
jgi:hypothetical protein